ncbi:MAG: hypothetical protein WBV33_14045 [Terracidiphilus sp.]
MHEFTRPVLVILWGILSAASLAAQMPFYTDDTGVTDPRVLHIEIFNEYDALQSSQYPNLNQNTANFKVNYGLPHNLELDIDAPWLSIYRAPGQQNSTGGGDTDMGIKWRLRDFTTGSRAPALAASMYIEFPTGNVRQQLGSGLTDYWLNSIAQEPFTDKTRLTANYGFLFAGNTSTGVIGVQTKRGHVYTGGLSLVHDFSSHLSLGAEAYGGVADTSGLGRDQLQGLGGGWYTVRDGLSFTFGILGGKYEASPSIGGQMGFEVDLPTVLRSHR